LDKPPFEVADGYGIDVSNLEAACSWYKEKLGFRDAPEVDEDDFGRPSRGLKLSDNGTALSLVEKNQERQAQQHIIFYASKLDKARDWLVKRGIPASAVETDSGGNRFFKFQDLDGNPIELCLEP
jgi:catechol 2,3-dioxygenase-like lactoylglutathione lyase family enzyme